MVLNEVMSHVRIRFTTEITTCRDFKSRQFAQIIEGDSSKQYSFLRSYGVELIRASPEKTFKLNIDSPGPGLQPRFERCYTCFDETNK